MKLPGRKELSNDGDFPRIIVVNDCFISDFLTVSGRQGCQIWDPNWVRLATNWTNLGLFKWAPKCTETDLKKPQICPIWGQSDPIWIPKLTSLPPANS